ncbi:hypothetical protein Q7P35_010379 [Cladosporium inversicolor]
MSEKPDLELQASPTMPELALEQKDTTPKSPNKKNSLRSRLWKAFCIIEFHFMASALHGYAIAHAQQIHQNRWDEVMIPDVENLVDWIKLFVSTSSERISPWMNSTAFFFIVIASFVGYAWSYFDSNKGTDRFQRHFLASITGFGYVVALRLGFGPMISTFCVAPRAVIVGLLVSDLVHSVFPGLQYRIDESPSGEVGSVVDEKA